MKNPVPVPKAFLSAYGSLTAALVSFTLLLRFFEHFTFTSRVLLPGGYGTLAAGLLNDSLFALGYCLLLFLPAAYLWKRKPLAAHRFFVAASVLYLLLQSLLVRYFLTTKTLLGADLFGYSFADIKTTISSSASIEISDVFPLILLVLFIAMLGFIRKQKTQLHPFFAVVFCTLGALGFFVAAPLPVRGGAAQPLTLNKTKYFLSANLLPSPNTLKQLTFSGYPLQRADVSTDALTPFFKPGAQKPNIVFLIVEGLGRDFTGPGASYGGFTPFLDSMAGQSLYWNNFLSSAGRSFAALPSLLGSLPYSKNGFNELGQQMPDHLSLIQLLKANGYRSHFFYGGNANFDYQDLFLEQQGNDYILDENKFGPGYNRNFGNQYSWGFADGDVYKRSLEWLQPQAAQPLLNIYVTLSTHEPFAVPGAATYAALVEKKLAALPAATRQKFEQHREVWQALQYADESIRQFMTDYAKRPDFENTIFIITGDHRLVPVPEQNALSRFHVPLIIYSKLLQRTASFNALSSHLDVTPSLVQLLRHYSGMQLPQTVSWVGKGLDTGQVFNPSYTVPLMRNKNVLEEYIAGNKLLAGNQLYQINEGLQLEPLPAEAGQQLLGARLDSFRQLNQYVCLQNKLYKTEATAPGNVSSNSAFTAPEQKTLDSFSMGISAPDALLAKASQLASAGNYAACRLLCRKVLQGSPNYHDVRVLYGRTYTWEKKYGEAIETFKEVVRRSPGFEDAYLAWTDAELWSGHSTSASRIAAQGLKAVPESKRLQAKAAALPK